MTLFFIRFDTVDMSGTQLTPDPELAAVPAAPIPSVPDSSQMTTSHAKTDDLASPAAAVPTLLLGLLAASSYSIANLALRGLSKTDGGAGWDMWVAGTKALPTLVVAVSLLLARRLRRQSTFAGWEFVWPIVLAAMFNQLGGNFGFQVSLRAIGLAIAVPICFASIICSGAVVGRLVLNDPVSIRTGISMGLMVASIVFLSTAAKSRTEDNTAERDATRSTVALTLSVGTESSFRKGPLSVSAGVAMSILSGLCYGVTGVFIRKAVRSQMPVEATLFLFSAAGFLVLCPLSLLLMPVRTIADSSAAEWLTIAIAGIFNALGFFAITHAMRYMTISRANVINASQNAMCAVGAMILFGESLAITGLIGIGLTIAGLLVLDR